MYQLKPPINIRLKLLKFQACNILHFHFEKLYSFFLPSRDEKLKEQFGIITQPFTFKKKFQIPNFNKFILYNYFFKLHFLNSSITFLSVVSSMSPIIIFRFPGDLAQDRGLKSLHHLRGYLHESIIVMTTVPKSLTVLQYKRNNLSILQLSCFLGQPL